MYEPLAPCPSCSRHVRTTEASCPFCKNALPASIVHAAVPGSAQRLTRAAAFAFTASLAVTAVTAATGCSGTTVPTADAGGAKDGSATDGAAAADAARDSSVVPDDGGNVALYGAPPYGIPPFDEDSGPDDAGGGGAKYGGPPIDAGNG